MFPCDSPRLQGLITKVAKKSDKPAGALDADDTQGLLTGLFAEENEFDRRALWRIGSWGVVTIGAVVFAVYANQSALGWRRDQIAADDFARQAQQIRQLARESQVENRKLASAVDTLNGDRDRLYSRVTVLEQGLDSVTGAIAKQTAAASAKPIAASSATELQAVQQNPPAQPAPQVAPVATAPAAAPLEKPRAEAAKQEPQVTAAIPAPAASTPAPTPLAVTKSMMGPPDPAAPKLIEAPKPAAAAAPAIVPASAAAPKPEALAAIPAEAPKDEADEETKTAIQRTEFAVDLGSANSVGGLRAIWRTVVASNAALKALTPIILVRENKSGLGAQLRLAAGPLQDAATAAKICAALAGVKRGCETTVYDGQRLAMAAGEALPAPGAKSDQTATLPAPAKRSWTRHARKDEPPPKEEPKSAISSWFNSKKP
jgi:hypothetical protein